MEKPDAIEQAVALAEAETCVRGGGAKIPLCLSEDSKSRAGFWTEEEDEYIRKNHGRVSEDDLVAYLGRTWSAVHIRITRELYLVAPSKNPSLLTGEQVSWGLGLDGKSIHRLMDTGLMPHRILPAKDKTRVIDRQVLMRWLLKPEHWVYFKTERVGAVRPKGKRLLSDAYDFVFWDAAGQLVRKARAKWKDEWLTPGQVADIMGYKRKPNNGKAQSHMLNKAILEGNLKAVRWGNWRILRSSLPPADMMFNAYGKLIKKEDSGRQRCSKCGELGHCCLTCGRTTAHRLRKKVHKTWGGQLACGRAYENDPEKSGHWKDVTCGRCLKRR